MKLKSIVTLEARLAMVIGDREFASELIERPIILSKQERKALTVAQTICEHGWELEEQRAILEGHDELNERQSVFGWAAIYLRETLRDS